MSSPKPAAGSQEPRADLVGRTIADRFEVVARLGAGGMGEVYRASDTRLKRSVALKRVSPDLRYDQRFTQRLQHEAELASGLNDPHVAAIYDVFEAEDELFLVMEFVEGTNLRHRLLRPLPFDEFLGIAVQCAAALAAAQARGILHGDIKPENIMLSATGQVKVLDFGVAKRMPGFEGGTTLETLAASPSLSGTPLYMAPEVLLAKGRDTRADIFALGVVFYESISARHPFHADSFIGVANRILQETPAPLRESNSDLPAELDRIVAKMLAKDQADRYATAADLLVDLRALQRVTPFGLRQPSTAPSRQLQRPGGAHERTSWIWRGLVPLGLALLLIVGVILFRRGGGFGGRLAPSPVINSLAVLPLKNVSSDPGQDYFAEGMTDALTSELAGIGSLRVVSRTSAMVYKDAKMSAPEIARKLQVDAVIEGSVARFGNKVKIIASLVQVSPERTLWTRPYERDLSDVLVLESDVARSVAEDINARLTTQERARLTRQRSRINPEAYDAFLNGRHYWEVRTVDGLKKSLGYYQRAIDIDPTYAQAYAGLADSYATLGNNRFLPPSEAFPAAKSAAQKALGLDEGLAEAHASLAFALWNYDFDWDLVEREYKRAIELNPSYATAYHWYSGYLSGMGRHVEAIAAIERARVLDPLSPRINANVGFILYFARQYDKAIEELRKAQQMDPASGAPDLYLGMTYLQTGNFPEAIDALKRNLKVPNSTLSASLDLIYGYAVAGQTDTAREMLRRLLREANGNYVPALWVARVYAALGEKENALHWLEKAYEERSPQLPFLNVDPRFDSLRPAPRFQDLLRRMKLQPQGGAQSR